MIRIDKIWFVRGGKYLYKAQALLHTMLLFCGYNQQFTASSFFAVIISVGHMKSPGLCLSLCTEWIEEHSSAGAPITAYIPNHLETYREPPSGPQLPPVPGYKREHQSAAVNKQDYFAVDDH